MIGRSSKSNKEFVVPICTTPCVLSTSTKYSFVFLLKSTSLKLHGVVVQDAFCIGLYCLCRCAVPSVPEPDGLVNIVHNVKRVKISLTAKRCVRLGTYEPNLNFCLWRKATVNKICNSKSARRLKWDTAEISLNGSEGCELKNQSHLMTFGVFVPVC